MSECQYVFDARRVNCGSLSKRKRAKLAELDEETRIDRPFLLWLFDNVDELDIDREVTSSGPESAATRPTHTPES